MFSIFEVKVFEPFEVNLPVYEENTSDLESASYQTVLIFRIWLKEMFSNSICPILMENMDESVVAQVPAVSGTHEHVYSWRVF